MMKLMLPFTPHLSYECLELLKCSELNNWPEVKGNLPEEISMAIQINGRTRDIIKTKKNATENEINKIILEQSKAKKFIQDKKITKTIFVKNKIINYIISD